MTVDEIKAAIPLLTLDQRAEIARFLHGWEEDDWDKTIKRDIAEGKLATLLHDVDADIKSGKLSDLP